MLMMCDNNRIRGRDPQEPKWQDFETAVEGFVVEGGRGGEEECEIVSRLRTGRWKRRKEHVAYLLDCESGFVGMYGVRWERCAWYGMGSWLIVRLSIWMEYWDGSSTVVLLGHVEELAGIGIDF
jgi:hypothetical protein